MAKGSSSGSVEKQTKPVSERTFINGREVSSALYNKGNNTYTNTINMTPGEQGIMDTGIKSYGDLLGQVAPNIATTDAERQKYAQELFQPQAGRLEDNYNKAIGEASGQANSRGMLHSIGFGDYVINQLNKNKEQQLSDMFNQAQTQSYGLSSAKLEPIIQGLSVFDTSINAPQNRGLAMLNPSTQGAQSANALNVARAQLTQNQPRGFFSSLFG